MIKKLIRQMLVAQIFSALTVSLCLLIDSIIIGQYLGVGAIAAYGALNKFGVYLLLVALSVLPATSQYPFVTGGNLIFSTLICYFTKDKPGPRELIALLLSFLAIAALLWL